MYTCSSVRGIQDDSHFHGLKAFWMYLVCVKPQVLQQWNCFQEKCSNYLLDLPTRPGEIKIFKSIHPFSLQAASSFQTAISSSSDSRYCWGNSSNIWLLAPTQNLDSAISSGNACFWHVNTFLMLVKSIASLIPVIWKTKPSLLLQKSNLGRGNDVIEGKNILIPRGTLEVLTVRKVIETLRVAGSILPFLSDEAEIRVDTWRQI